MTVQTETSSVTYTGNGATTSFVIPFKFIKNDDIKATLITIATNAGVVLVSSAYSLTGAGGDTGGTLTYSPAISTLFKLKIERVVSYTQDLHIANESGFLPDSIEAQLDRMTMQMQQLKQVVADYVAGGTIVSLTGAVAGPAVSGDNNFPSFNGTTGKTLKDSGLNSTSFSAVGHVHSFASLTGKPTTFAGYGITDTVKSVLGLYTLAAAGGYIGDDAINAKRYYKDGVEFGSVRMTPQASTAGTAIDFTSIPSWVKKITVSFADVSTNGAADWLVQVGAGAVQTAGYRASSAIEGTGTVQSTAGFIMQNYIGATQSISGIMEIIQVSATLWVASVLYSDFTFPRMFGGSGNVILTSTPLDRIRITTVGGVNTFDAGSIGVIYE